MLNSPLAKRFRRNFMIHDKGSFWRLQPPKKNGYVIWLYEKSRNLWIVFFFNEPNLKMTATTTLKSFNYLSLINHRLNHNTYAILSSRLPRFHQPATSSFSNSGFRFFQSNHLFFCKFSFYLNSTFVWFLHVTCSTKCLKDSCFL